MKNLPFSYIGSVNSSAKIAKGEKFNIDTLVVYLAPYKLSGYNTCPMATKECIFLCLNESGRVIMDYKNIIINARVKKTQAFFNPELKPIFINQLFKEIERAKNKAISKGNRFAVRINGTSDLNPVQFQKDGRNILESFPDVQFYDYTKVLNRLVLTEKYKNYDLTFSYSGENWCECEQYLKAGQKVAVVFNVKKGQPLPTEYKGYRVIDGDISDYRPSDDKGVIVGLRFKRVKNKDANNSLREFKFVVSDFQLN